MVFIGLKPDSTLDASQLASRLREEGILVGLVGSRRIRMVTHNDVPPEAVRKTLQAFSRVFEH
jgi:hypothetical protein